MDGIEQVVYWLIQQTSSLPPDDEWFTRRERSYLEGFRFEKRREEWRLGRWTAKLALQNALFPGERLHDFEIRPDNDGAPVVTLRGRTVPVTLSISHRAGLSLCTLASGIAALGCDLELIESRSEAFISDYLTPFEQHLVLSSDFNRHPLLANLIWTGKESVMKALREGLRLDTRAIEVDFDPPVPDQEWHVLTARLISNNRCFQGWWKQQDDFVFSVISDPPLITLPVPVQVKPLL